MRRDNSNYPIDNEGGADNSHPLQLRRGSDAQARRSLLDKYNNDLNHTDDVSYNQNNPVDSNNQSVIRLEQELKQGRNKKLMVGLIVGGVAVVITAIVLILVLHKSSHHHDDDGHHDDGNVFDTIYNPYSLTEVTPAEAYSYRKYSLTRNSTLKGNYSSSYALHDTLDCKFIERAIMKTYVVNSFKAMRVQIYDQNSSVYQVGNEFLNPRFVETMHSDLLKYTQMEKEFRVEVNSNVDRRVNESQFSFSAFYHNESAKPGVLTPLIEFLTTRNQEMFLMSRYQQISFKVKSTRIFGWGSRTSDSLFLNSGNYTIFPQAGDTLQDNGTTGANQGSGMHPFLMFQITNTNRFAGIFLLNSNPMSLELNLTSSESAKLTFRTTGGILDFFIFYGPSYNEVLRQYADVIGRPILMPYWAHGFFVKSLAYNDTIFTLAAIKQFKDQGFPISGIVLPLKYTNSYFSKTSSYIKAIREEYPTSKDLQVILPFSYFVPNVTEQLPWLDKFMNGSNKQSFAVKAEGEKLYVDMEPDERDDQKFGGWCMDVFNPTFTNEFLEPELLRSMTDIYQGYWIQKNIPTILDHHQEIEDPWVLPYRPGGAFEHGQAAKTLPEQATHNMGTNNVEYHHSLHSLYGSKLAMQVADNLPQKRVNQDTPFVLSDSTSFGLGQYGVAHLLNTQEPSFADLRAAMVSMINFGMFRIQNVGMQMCNFKNKTSETDEELCARYFQLSLISPLAFQNDRQHDLTGHPFSFANLESKTSIISSLRQRMTLLIYMRTQLKRNEKYGGTLLRPLFTVYPDHPNSTDVSQILYGNSLLVCFAWTQGQKTMDIHLPKQNDWVNLNTFETYPGGKVLEGVQVGLSYGIPVFQQAGTIVPIQSPQTQIHELRNTPIDLSIALGGDIAHGFVYMEDGSDADFRTEFHEIWVENNVITFKQQDTLGLNAEANDTIIDQIILSFVSSPVNQACALLKDMRTIQTLYAEGYDELRKQVFIQSNDDNRPHETYRDLKINEVAYIYYGYSETNITCDQSLFTYKIEELYLNFQEDAFEARVSQQISKIVGKTRAPDQYLKIEMLTDNSLHFQLSDRRLYLNSTDRETSTLIYDRNFTDLKSTPKTVNLIDVLKVVMTEESFCFNITKPNQTEEVLFTTCGQMQMQHSIHSVFNYAQPKSHPKRFFGLGERKGSFFLNNHTTYAMYNNDNNVLNSQQVNGRVVEHGRNGFHPIIYSSLMDSTNLTALIFYTGHGLEVTLNEDTVMGGLFSIQSSSRDVEFSFIFDLNPIKTSEAVFKHIQLGKLLLDDRKSHVLPPPSWAFGHHLSLPKSGLNQPGQIAKLFTEIQNVTKFPLEGLLLEQSDLDHELSYTMNPARFDKEALDYMSEHKLSLFAISNSGYPKEGQNKSDIVIEFINENEVYVKDLLGRPQEGWGNNGKLLYIDYSRTEAAQIARMCIGYFFVDFGTNFKYGISLKRNEISTQLCNQDTCYRDLKGIPTEAWFLQKPGNDEMNVNTFDQVVYSLGKEEQLHNLNGLMEQMAYASSYTHIPLLLSDSTALGSGKLGFVARQLDYYEVSDTDISLATQQIQSLSVMGMPLLSVKFPTKIESDVEFAERAIQFGAYTTSLSTLDFYAEASRYMSANQINEVSLLMRQKYSFMAYARTQVFKQINMGTPFIRPLFFMPEVFLKLDVQDSVNTQYMYGPSIISVPHWSYTDLPFPLNNWCTAQGGHSTVVACFEQTPPLEVNGQQQVFLMEGSITPLYSLNRSTVSNFTRADDLEKETLDMHVFNDADGTGMSKGELLIDGGVGTVINSDYCYLEFAMVKHIITFTDRSSEFEGQGSTGCNLKPGYQMRYLYVYDYTNQISTGYQSAKINGDVEMEHIHTDPSKKVATFQVKAVSNEGKKSVHWFDIKTIEFIYDTPN